MDKRIEKTITNLKQNNMEGYFVKDKEELLLLLKSLMKQGDTIGCGDSGTLEETGVFAYIRNSGHTFYDKHQEGLTAEEKRKIYLHNFDADIFLTGTNAITVDGKLFNIDGNGSRVAPMLYGPRQVIVVAGINKLTDTVEEAINRTRQIAAPMDAMRLKKNTPCTKLGKCIDCGHEQRICNDFVLIARQFIKDRIKVILINQKYGF
ncbi:lactate utilization protein [Anaerocolumna sp. AGMB13025]|uniref:lactate utilization protein n=1 Tax=Anaerocolumna sp. AGMB13025 TaxID=3039116 RepID=UPI00241C3792|nr:lactate utilization protein [Anaerocolumna sp. AGMB13025]WFR55141.1 lactate utilization protein [Anaerocolumna sp. AGMB13025]